MIKIKDIAYVRFSAPDLDKMESFLGDFGLVRAARSDKALHMRGTDALPFLHVTELGDPGYRAVGFEAASEADLRALAKAEDVPVEQSSAPGGGLIVRLKDPDGMAVEVVSGRKAEALAAPSLPVMNDGATRRRKGEVLRIAKGASTVKRLGHAVLNVTDFRKSEAWYKSRFGFITSDEIFLGTPETALGAFMRCDRGEEPTDHHTLFLVGTGKPGFNHAAFEVAHFDDLMRGHQLLKEKGYGHVWGIGRHILGSQIFDYWKDPWGHKVEHWTDGDLLSAAWGSRQTPIDDLMATQWGDTAPPAMAE